MEPGGDRPIFHKKGGVSSWSGALCFCLVPHIPSLTDRSREPLVLLPTGFASTSNSVSLYRRLLVMRVVLPQPWSMLYDRQYARGLKGLNRGRTFSSSCYNLHLQSVVGGRPQVGHYKQVMIRWQDLGLGDDAVGQAVLPAFSCDFSPGDLEARDSLMGSQPRDAPVEIAGDVSLIGREGSRQVLRFSKNFRKP